MDARDNVIFHDVDRQKALKLTLCLGAFGIHRFYLHQPFSGIAYLLFFWTCVPLVLSLIDAAFLYRMSDEEFQEEFNEMPHPV